MAPLALGIGATSAVFSPIWAVVLRPLPFPHPERLVTVEQVNPKAKQPFVAPVRLADWNRLNTTFQSISGYYMQDDSELSGELPERLTRAVLLASFSASAILLACVGLYGTISYTVNVRRREVGLRLELGAMRTQVAGQFVGSGMAVAGIGLRRGTRDVDCVYAAAIGHAVRRIGDGPSDAGGRGGGRARRLGSRGAHSRGTGGAAGPITVLRDERAGCGTRAEPEAHNRRLFAFPLAYA
jgi:hypothetical protein